jgi:hypothetical protein
VRTLLKQGSPEAAVVIFRHLEREAGLAQLGFREPFVASVDQVLMEALDKLPREPGSEASLAAERGAARRLLELAASLRGPLTDASAHAYVEALAQLSSEMKARPQQLPPGNVLDRMGVAFQLIEARSLGEALPLVQYLLIAARSSPPVPAAGWSARLADAVLRSMTVEGQSLSDVSGRKAGAARETAEMARLDAALVWLEKRLEELGKRLAASPNDRCEWRKRWLVSEILLRASADVWAVPAALPVERFHEIEGFPSDLLARLDSTLTREGTLRVDAAVMPDTTLLVDLARTLGCPPNLIRRVEEDDMGCM